MLDKSDIANCSLISTPLTIPCKLSSSDSTQKDEEACFMKNIPYFQVLGSLLYFVNCTRPIKIRGKLDINHWVVLIWILSTIEIWYSLVRHNLGQTTPKYYHGYQTHHKDESMKIVEEIMILLAPHQVFCLLLQLVQLHGV